MKKETLLKIAVGVLLLLNLGTLAFLRWGRPPRPGNAYIDHLIVSTLQLDENQKAVFGQLKRTHRQQMEESERLYHAALSNYFDLLKKDTVTSVERDSLERELASIQIKRAVFTYDHFQALKSNCRPEQQAHFSELLPELIQVILPKRQRNHPAKTPDDK